MNKTRTEDNSREDGHRSIKNMLFFESQVLVESNWLIFEWETFLKEVLLYVSLLHSSAEGHVPSFLAQVSALCLWPFQTQETSASRSVKCLWTNHIFSSFNSNSLSISPSSFQLHGPDDLMQGECL